MNQKSGYLTTTTTMPVNFPKDDSQAQAVENSTVKPPRKITEIRFKLGELPEQQKQNPAARPSVSIADQGGHDEDTRRSRARSISKMVRRLSRHIRMQSKANVLEGLRLGAGAEGGSEEDEEDDEEEDEGEEEQWEGEEDTPPHTPAMKKLTREYAPDVGGGIQRSTLLKMDEAPLKKLVKDMQSHVERVKSENIVLERALDAMQVRDREIKANIPKFAYQYPWEKSQGDDTTSSEPKKLTTEVCETESSAEEETEEEQEGEESDQDQEIFHPTTDLNLEDPMFEGMTDESREALRKFMLSVGDVAPENFDVVKYKYKDLLRAATAGDDRHDHVHHGGHGKQTATAASEEQSRYDLDSGKVPQGSSDRKRSTKAGKKRPSRKSRQSRVSRQSGGRISSDDSVALARQRNLMEQDVSAWELPAEVEKTKSEEEFPDFDPKTADEIPLRFKNQFIEGQIHIMIAEWGEQRLSQAYKDNTCVLVYIDAYQTSYVMVKQLISGLHKLHEKSIHPVSHRLKAESLQLFMKQMKSFLMSEASKRWMEWQELRKDRRHIETQLRQNEELGESLQVIDFDKLWIENTQLVHDIEESHERIQKLKLINANCMENLKQSKSKLFRQLANSKMIEDSIHVRLALKDRFEKEMTRKKDEILRAKQRIKFFQRRLLAFRTPNLLDYIGTKAEEQMLSQEKKSMQLKIDSAKAAGARVKEGFGNFENFPAPLRKVMHAINLERLEAMKKEVHERSLMNLINERDDEAFAKELFEAGSRQEPAKESRHKGYNGEKRTKKNLLLSRSTLLSLGVGSTAAMSVRASRKTNAEAAADIDDAALIRSKLPIPTPGNLMLLAEQQEREDKEFERLSKLKSEAKVKSAHRRGASGRKITSIQAVPSPQVPRQSAAVQSSVRAESVAPRKSVTIGEMERRKSVAIDETSAQRRKPTSVGDVGMQRRKSMTMAAPTTRGSLGPPPPAYMSKRRLTIAEVKSTHAEKMKGEDQLVLKAGALEDAPAQSQR